MTFKQLQQFSRPHFYSLYIENLLPMKARSFLRSLCALTAVLSFIISFNQGSFYFSGSDGLFFLSVFFYLIFFLIEVFYRSSMNDGLPVRLKESISFFERKLDYSLSQIIYETDEIDLSRALFETEVGAKVMLRSGISKESFQAFIFSNRIPAISSTLILEEGSDLPQYLAALYEADKSLESFLSQNSVSKAEFVAAGSWVSGENEKKQRSNRFWSRENLGAIPSIGNNWSYGISVDLGKYGVSFDKTVDLFDINLENNYRDKEVGLLENILQRKAEANAIIIDDDEKVCRDIMARLLKRIKLGIALPSIEYKNIVELDTNSLVAAYKNKNELEAEILKILNQSLLAGNIIIYINNLAGFISSTRNLGINLGALISPFLESKDLQVVATATNADFHFFIETASVLLDKFERVIPDKAGVEASVMVLIEETADLESRYGIAFSYPAILAIASAAERFITYGEMPGKAIDMIFEIAPWATERKISLLREKEVSLFVKEKTGIATGEIKAEEAERIEHLEEIIHQRIIGQNEAVSDISKAIRRSRAGVENPKRPIASFLFLGPTGVGKTEISKALAESFFGKESQMIRFDMSEYNGGDAMERLIGDFAMNKTGILASKIRDNPYSVLLLDEFEKAAPDVLDLFLQILDGGIFTDALGRQVGCRNLIIIATSNAGSEFIWQTIKEGKDLAKSKKAIIEKIIEERIFKPELLNRFDSTVLFHPLQTEELKNIAALELQKLSKRLKEQSDIELLINDDVINFLVEKGSDPEFGGRSVNRAIQNDIENLIADKMVRGLAKSGDKIEIKKEDLQ